MPAAANWDPRDEMVDGQMSTSMTADRTNEDQKARVYKVTGKVMLKSADSPVEKELKAGDEIRQGDSLYTEKGASVSLAFDSLKKNAVQIPADSHAIFTSIEPTDIKLENGSIFSAVDGLAKGSTWTVTTPSAVAAVRGTHFEVAFDAASGSFSAMTFEDANDGKLSAIAVESLAGGEIVEIIEGKEMSLEQGEIPAQDMVQEIKPEAAQEGRRFMQEVAQVREKTSDDKSANNPNGPNGPNGPGGQNGPNTTRHDGNSSANTNANFMNSPLGMNFAAARASGGESYAITGRDMFRPVGNEGPVRGPEGMGPPMTDFRNDPITDPVTEFLDPNMTTTITDRYVTPEMNTGTYVLRDPCASGTCEPPPCGNTHSPC